MPADVARKISESQRGKVISAQTRAKMSLAKVGDGRCANHFGEHTNKGNKNPRCRRWIVRFPDGTEREIIGVRAFCRKYALHRSHFTTRGRSKGYVLVSGLEK